MLVATTCPACKTVYNIDIDPKGQKTLRDVQNTCPSCNTVNNTQVIILNDNKRRARSVEKIVADLLKRMRALRFSIPETEQFSKFVEKQDLSSVSPRRLEKRAASKNPKFGKIIHSFRRYGVQTLSAILIGSVMVLKSCSFDVHVELDAAKMISAWKGEGQQFIVQTFVENEAKSVDGDMQNGHPDQRRNHPDTPSHRPTREGKNIGHGQSPPQKDGPHKG